MSELLRTADELARMDVHSRTPWITNAVDQLRMADKTIAGLKHDFSDLEVEFARAVQTIAELRSTPPASPASKPSGEDDRLERLEDAMHSIVNWCDAYPLKVFPEPDFAKAAQLLKAGGMTIDAISASNMRHVLEGIRKIADGAIARQRGGSDGSA